MEQSVGLTRNCIDKYYTKSDVVDICLNAVKKFINIGNDDLVIEPSAGNGAFINKIKTLNCNYLFYDLEPDHEEIVKQDYLFLKIEKNYPNIHIIGNPPFGRQSSLAIKFIKKSCEFCNSISFILPKSFKKDTLKKAFSLNFHLINEIELPDNSFLVNGISFNVPCIFQIWEKKAIPRECEVLLVPLNFQFVKKNQNPDISFRRVGVNAGKVSTDTNKSESSHYFIKFSKIPTVDLNTIIWIHDNTVGPRSISKQELIKKFNTLF